MKSIIKKRLKKAKGGWVEELPFALWAYRTSYKTATGHTPFSLAYGSEAMVPVEVDVPTHRRLGFDPEDNRELMNASLDLIEEKRTAAELRMAAQNRS